MFLLCSILFLSADTNAINDTKAQSTNVYSLKIQGFTWNKDTLNIIVVPPGNVSWWDPTYLDSALHAIGQWNEAINYFSSNYSDYSYLSAVNLKATVSNEALSGFDIYVNWTEFPLANTSSEIGLETTISQNNVILNCNISLATHTAHGDSLTEGDMQNVALHELGHSLGLGHCNYSYDTMSADYTLLSPPRLISTLDIYGVATIFGWLQNSFNFYPVNAWLNSPAVILPPNIPYTRFTCVFSRCYSSNACQQSSYRIAGFAVRVIYSP